MVHATPAFNDADVSTATKGKMKELVANGKRKKATRMTPWPLNQEMEPMPREPFEQCDLIERGRA